MIETVKREVKLLSVSDKSELSSADAELLDSAKVALKGAYAPYSKFHVAAAVLLENGVVVKGSNQENMAYPSGLCAERVAIFSASAFLAKSGFPLLR
jgi:cytidine deaminase